MNPRNSEKGFTLLELLISITLSILVVVILLAAMRIGYKSQQKGTERVEASQRMRILGDRITWLIRGAYPFLLNTQDEEMFFFSGESDKIGLVTSSVDRGGTGPEDLAGLKWVSLFVDREGLKVREKVFFLEDAFEDDGGTVTLLDPEVKKIEFEYFDVSVEDEEEEWVSDWDPEDREYLPAAVRVKITIGKGNKTALLPEIIVRISAQREQLQVE